MKAVPCPICGLEPSLPTITPELLYFRSHGHTPPKLGPRMPDESYAVEFAGTIYAMSPADWHHYESMARASEKLGNRFLEEAA